MIPLQNPSGLWVEGELIIQIFRSFAGLDDKPRSIMRFRKYSIGSQTPRRVEWESTRIKMDVRCSIRGNHHNGERGRRQNPFQID